MAALLTGIRFVVFAALVWLFVLALVVLQLWPELPRSGFKWAVLVALGPPMYVLGEAGCGWVLSEQHGYALSRASISLVRIFVALFVGLVLVGAGWSFSSWLASS